MPKLIRLYIVSVAIGFGLAGLLVALMLWFNVANLWHLVTHSDKGVLAVILLWLSNGVVFAGVQFAIAIMNMAGKDDDEPKGGLRAPNVEPPRILARVRVTADKPGLRNPRR
jgi:hypothetical protein